MLIFIQYYEMYIDSIAYKHYAKCIQVYYPSSSSSFSPSSSSHSSSAIIIITSSSRSFLFVSLIYWCVFKIVQYTFLNRRTRIVAKTKTRRSCLYNPSSLIQNFKLLTICYGCTAWFVFDGQKPKLLFLFHQILHYIICTLNGCRVSDCIIRCCVKVGFGYYNFTLFRLIQYKYYRFYLYFMQKTLSRHIKPGIK